MAACNPVNWSNRRVMRRMMCVAVISALLALMASGQSNRAQRAPSIQHVLLLSIDGAHALDIVKYVQANPHSAFADLSSMAVTYTNASLPIGDFYPGVLSLITGGTPNA